MPLRWLSAGSTATVTEPASSKGLIGVVTHNLNCLQPSALKPYLARPARHKPTLHTSDVRFPKHAALSPLLFTVTRTAAQPLSSADKDRMRDGSAHAACTRR